MRIFPAIILGMIVLCPTNRLQAEDWPGWRGPRGDGSSLEQNIPTRWSQKDNIAWKVEVPGVGYASPVVLGDAVFLVTCDEKTQERIFLSSTMSVDPRPQANSLPVAPHPAKAVIL